MKRNKYITSAWLLLLPTWLSQPISSWKTTTIKQTQHYLTQWLWDKYNTREKNNLTISKQPWDIESLKSYDHITSSTNSNQSTLPPSHTITDPSLVQNNNWKKIEDDKIDSSIIDNSAKQITTKIKNINTLSIDNTINNTIIHALTPEQLEEKKSAYLLAIVNKIQIHNDINFDIQIIRDHMYQILDESLVLENSTAEDRKYILRIKDNKNINIEFIKNNINAILVHLKSSNNKIVWLLITKKAIRGKIIDLLKKIHPHLNTNEIKYEDNSEIFVQSLVKIGDSMK